MRSVMIVLVAVLLVSTAWGQEKLDLSGQYITDEQLAEKLKGLPNLERLDLGGTKVTDAGIQELKKALPDCKIFDGN